MKARVIARRFRSLLSGLEARPGAGAGVGCHSKSLEHQSGAGSLSRLEPFVSPPTGLGRSDWVLPSKFVALCPNTCSPKPLQNPDVSSPAFALQFGPHLLSLSSVRFFQSSCQVSTAASSTPVSERSQQVGQDTVRIQEKHGVHEEAWRQRQREIQTTKSSSEGILTDLPSDNASAVKNSLELGSLSVRLRKEVGWNELGWTREEVFNWPNAISTARLLSGPLIAWMIVNELWRTAFVGLVIGAASDWLDGHVARKMGISSVLGSYLDPVADKFFIGSVVVSMAYTGLLHPGLVGLIVARDGVLMGGAFVYRAYSLGWQWNDWREFFRISVGGARMVEPLFISKVNTVLQLALVGVALLQPALSMEDVWHLVPSLSWSVVLTTSLSWVAYGYIYLKDSKNLSNLRPLVQTKPQKST